MPQTNRMNLRYPAGTDTPDVVRDMGFLAADLEAVMPRLLGASLQAGVLGAGDLKVTAGAGMTVNVAAGVATVPDQTDTYPALTPVFRAALNGLAVTAANGTNPRLDQVLIDADGNLSVLAGTPAAGATLDNRNGVAAVPNGYLRIADVLIPAASVSVAAGNIRDRRPWARGAFRRLSRVSGDIVTAAVSFTVIDATNLQPRIECSGAPIRVHLLGTVANNTTGGLMAFALMVDGALVDGPASGAGGTMIEYEPATNNQNYLPFTTVTTPAAGSHLIGPAARVNNSMTISASANNPLIMVVEEIARQNADNT